MAFCTSCGAKLDEGDLFCEYCGVRQDDSVPQPTVAAPAAPSYNQTAPVLPSYGSVSCGQVAAPAAPRKPLPRNVKIVLLAVAAVVVLLALFSFIMGKVNSPDKTIATFIESVMAQDFEAFSSVTRSADGELELTEASVAPFFALYHDRRTALEEYQEVLNTDLAALNRGRASIGNGVVRLVELDRILFKTYRVELSGVDILFSSNLDDTQVEVGGKTVILDTADTDCALRLLPGLYDILATHTDETLGETFSTELTGCELIHNNDFWYLNLEYGTVTLGDIGWDVSSLTVNGTDFGPVAFDPSGEFRIAPLPEDVEIVVTYDMDGVTLSDTFVWSGSYCWEYFYPEPTLDPDTAREMLDQVGTFVRDILAAYGSGNLAALEAMPAYGRSSVLKNLSNELEDSLDLDSHFRYVYHYTLREMEGDLNWDRDYSYDALTFNTSVFLGLDYTYERYYNGEMQTNLIDGAPSVYEKDSMLSVCVQRINGQWVIFDLDWTYFYNRNNMEDPYVM